MTTTQQIIDGLIIFSSCGDYKDRTVSVGHDVFYAAGPTPKEMGTITEKKLNDIGWEWNEEYGCWQIYV